MKHKKFKVDVSDWSLDSTKGLESYICEAAGEVIQHIVEKNDSYIYFPIEWESSDGIGGKRPDDPLTMYFRLGVSEYTEKPTFEFSLSDVIDDMIDLHMSREDKKVDPECTVFGELSSALRMLADRLDSSIRDS